VFDPDIGRAEKPLRVSAEASGVAAIGFLENLAGRGIVMD
jgi:hypothetical protein